MTILAFELVNVDEDQAEKAVRLAIDTIPSITTVKNKTLQIEPHDETRGIWARIEIESPNDAKKDFRENLVRYMKAFIEVILYKNTRLIVHVSLSDKDKEGNDK